MYVACVIAAWGQPASVWDIEQSGKAKSLQEIEREELDKAERVSTEQKHTSAMPRINQPGFWAIGSSYLAYMFGHFHSHLFLFTAERETQ